MNWGGESICNIRLTYVLVPKLFRYITLPKLIFSLLPLNFFVIFHVKIHMISTVYTCKCSMKKWNYEKYFPKPNINETIFCLIAADVSFGLEHCLLSMLLSLILHIGSRCKCTLLLIRKMVNHPPHLH